MSRAGGFKQLESMSGGGEGEGDRRPFNFTQRREEVKEEEKKKDEEVVD